jgi:hypothetical protein
LGDIAKEEPGVQSLRIYCKTLALEDGQCMDKFIGVKNGGLPSGLVGLSAASTCIDKYSLNEVSALDNMFDVDVTKLQNLARGMNTKRPDLEYHQQPGGKSSRRAYTEEQRRRAAEAHRESIERVNAVAWDIASARLTQMVSGFDRNGLLTFGIVVSLTAAKRVQSEVAYYAGYYEPWREGEQPEATCQQGKKTCETDSGSEVPNPDYEGSDNDGNDNDGNDNDGNDNEGSDNEGSDNETNDTDSESESGSDSPFEDTMEDDDFDAIPDVEETPVPFDETTQTALQKCQEEEERKIRDELGSTTPDPESPLKEEERKNQAEFLLLRGVCDKSFYGAAFCQIWKNQQASTPLSEEDQQILNEFREGITICPVNLITEVDCEMTKQELWKRYAVKDEFEGPINNLLAPQLPPAEIPQLVTGFDLGGIVGNELSHGVTGGTLSVKPGAKPPRVRSRLPAAASPFSLDAWNYKNSILQSNGKRI